MAAYASTVTSTMKRAVKVDQVTGIGMFIGKCDITNYNTTLAAITDITGKFRTLMQVVCTAISDNGYLVRWDAAGTAFKAYYPTNTSDQTPTADITAAAAAEVAADVDIGVVEFVATGLV